MTTTETHAQRTDGPIHLYFGLTYANYEVLHRTLMQSMPLDWQERMVACLTELDAAYAHIETPEAFIVEPARECTYYDLTSADRRQLSIRPGNDGFYDKRGVWHRPDDLMLVPVAVDPVPHYNRGRTYIEPGGANATKAAEVAS